MHPAAKSVLYVNHSMATGGIETLIVDLAAALRTRGFAPAVAVFEGGGSLERRLGELDIPVHPLAKREGLDPSLVFRLRRLIVRAAVDVVHSQNFSTWLYAASALRGLSRPVRHVHTEHSNVEYRARRYWLERLLGRLTTYTVAVSAAVRDTMIGDIGIPSDRVRLIYNGIDTRRFAPDAARRQHMRRVLGVGPDGVVIGVVARLAAVKDHATLIRAFARLRRSCARPVQLVLVGEGPERPALEREIAAQGLGAEVRLAGEQHDTHDWLRAFDIYALSSISEGMNLTLLEAMSTALPVAATDVGGNPEIVRAGETGLLVPARSEDAMAAALSRLVESEGLRARMGAAGRRRVEERFSQESMLQAYIELYRSMAAGQH